MRIRLTITLLWRQLSGLYKFTQFVTVVNPVLCSPALTSHWYPLSTDTGCPGKTRSSTRSPIAKARRLEQSQLLRNRKPDGPRL